jgi:hypothetical protein
MPIRPGGLPASLAAAVVVLLLALAARHWLIEPAAIAFACEPAPWSGGCAVRTLIIRSFVQQEIGWFAFGAGLVATLIRARPVAALALAAGAAGLVLYSFEPAAVGALLGLLVLVRGHATQAASSAIVAE